MQRTFTILKPDTVQAGNAGLVIDRLIKEGFRIRAVKMLHLTKSQAEGFYYVHKERPFFGDLVRFMTEGPIVLMILEAEGAIEKLRKLMGATDPGKADAGTIRKQFGTNIERNAIHGSDGPETFAYEMSYFFSQLEIV
jgi:nucleoside-diphosphate kinase